MEKVEELEEKLEWLENEYRVTPYNKTTDKYLGMLRRKISRTKLEIKEAKKRKHGIGFITRHKGNATAVLVGFPSTGKSSILNRIARVDSKVGSYAFTTTTIIEGMLEYKNAQIQVLDLPGIIEGAHIGIGMGRKIISAVRGSDLIVFVADSSADYAKQMQVLINELAALGIFVKEKPDVKWLNSKGFKIEVNKSTLPNEVIEMIFKEMGIKECRIRILGELDDNELLAIVAGKATYINAIIALNKSDMVNESELPKSIFGIEAVPVSALTGKGINELIEKVYEKLGLINIYLKPKGKAEEPIAMRKGATVGDVARKLHSEILEQMKCAYVNGPSVKFRNQRVGAEHVLEDGDVITFIK